MLCSYANLDDDRVEQIKALEKEIGKTMVAMACWDAKTSDLTEEQISKIKMLEKSTGMVLLAVNE